MGIVTHIYRAPGFGDRCNSFSGDDPAVEIDDFEDCVIVYGCLASSNLVRASIPGP